MPEQKVKVGKYAVRKYAVVNGTNYTLIVPPLLINTAQEMIFSLAGNITNDDSVNSTYCNNISIFGIIQFIFAR